MTMPPEIRVPAPSLGRQVFSRYDLIVTPCGGEWIVVRGNRSRYHRQVYVGGPFASAELAEQEKQRRIEGGE